MFDLLNKDELTSNLWAKQIQATPSPKKKPAMDSSLVFGKVFADHMLEIDWEQASGFGDPRITPYREKPCRVERPIGLVEGRRDTISFVPGFHVFYLANKIFCGFFECGSQPLGQCFVKLYRQAAARPRRSGLALWSTVLRGNEGQ